MLVVMKAQATEEQVRSVCQKIENLGYRAHAMPGTQRTAIGITGNKGEVEQGTLEEMPGVQEVIKVSKPYKLVSRDVKEDNTVIRFPGTDAAIGGRGLAIVAGPCAIESREQAFAVAERVHRAGAQFFRGGAYKPRTSPYSFQGLGEEGLRILAEVRERWGLRIVTELERRYAAFDGLNLTQPTLAGLVKHNGPLLDASGTPAERYRPRGVPASIIRYDRLQRLDLSLHASLEAQAAAIADDIAYDAHDIDDGLRAGLFPLAALRAAVPFVEGLLGEIDELRPGLEEPRVIHELTRRVITRFIEDAMRESRRRIAESGVDSPEAVAAAGRSLVGHSEAIEAADRDVKAFLFAHMYRHPDVRRVRDRADAIVRRLFKAYLTDPSAMPPDWAAKAHQGERARAVADYIAGMTDRFAIAEHARIFDDASDLR